MKAFLFLLTALSIPAAHASLVDLTISGVLGPKLGGVDPLGLTGQNFLVTAMFDKGLLPINTTFDSATYDLNGNLQITAGKIILSGYNATLTLTAPPSGPDTMALAFSVVEFSFNPQVYASLSLPAGTLSSTAIQDFSASVTQPPSQLVYDVLGNSEGISGNLGITGTASISGLTPSGVPEPATIGLMGIGFALIALARVKLRAR